MKVTNWKGNDLTGEWVVTRKIDGVQARLDFNTSTAYSKNGNTLYEIWVGHYHLGQGYDPPTSPQRIGTVYAPSFKQACYIYELESSLRTAKSTKLGNRDYVSSYDPHKMYNSWTGYYYPSREEALKSFKR
jgi:hypothetical protein